MNDKDNNNLTDEELEQVDGGMINGIHDSKNPPKIETNNPNYDKSGFNFNFKQ